MRSGIDSVFFDRVCMRFAAACRYVGDSVKANRMHTRSPAHGAEMHEPLLTRIAVSAIIALFLRNVRATLSYNIALSSALLHSKKDATPYALSHTAQ